MPQVFKVGSYWVYFWANENEPLEPIHVHVAQGAPNSNATKIWITKAGGCYLCNNNSQIPPRVLRNIMAVIEARSGEVIEKWTFNVICNEEKTVPVEWITEDGSDVTEDFSLFLARSAISAEQLKIPPKPCGKMTAAGLFCVFGRVWGGSMHRAKNCRCPALQYMQTVRGAEQNSPPESGEFL